MVESPPMGHTKGGDSRMDTIFQLTLGCANATVAAMNACAFVSSKKTVDMVATVAWLGSTVYWFWRAALS